MTEEKHDEPESSYLKEVGRDCYIYYVLTKNKRSIILGIFSPFSEKLNGTQEKE